MISSSIGPPLPLLFLVSSLATLDGTRVDLVVLTELGCLDTLLVCVIKLHRDNSLTVSGSCSQAFVKISPTTIAVLHEALVFGLLLCKILS